MRILFLIAFLISNSFSLHAHASDNEVEKSRFARVQVAEARLNLAQTLARTMLDKATVCTESSPGPQILNLLEYGLLNLGNDLQINPTPARRQIISSFPEIDRALAGGFSYRLVSHGRYGLLTGAASFDDEKTAIEQALSGVVIYGPRQRIGKDRRGIEIKVANETFEFKSDHAVVRTDLQGNKHEGKWALGDPYRYATVPVALQIKSIFSDGTSITLAATETRSIYLGYGGFTYYPMTLNQNDEPVLDMHAAYSDFDGACTAFAQ